MADNLSPADRSRTMRAVKGKGTSLERKLFGMLAGMRLHGWKKNVERIAGKPDVVFPEQRVVIFVDGCFWHGCPHCGRPLPQANREYWERKIRRNRQRDRENTLSLESEGWRVLRIWEHEMSCRNSRQTIREVVRRTVKGEREG